MTLASKRAWRLRPFRASALRQSWRPNTACVRRCSISGRRRCSPGVSGHVTPAQALVRLLSQSGLTYEFTAPNTVVLSERAASAQPVGPGVVVLDQITMVGSGNSVTEGTGSYTTGAMRAATGLSLEKWGDERPRIYSRGFYMLAAGGYPN